MIIKKKEKVQTLNLIVDVWVLKVVAKKNQRPITGCQWQRCKRHRGVLLSAVGGSSTCSCYFWGWRGQKCVRLWRNTNACFWSFMSFIGWIFPPCAFRCDSRSLRQCPLPRPLWDSFVIILLLVPKESSTIHSTGRNERMEIRMFLWVMIQLDCKVGTL